MVGVTVSIIGAVFQSSAQNITWMCCARVVTGLGVGAIDAGELCFMIAHPLISDFNQFSYTCMELRGLISSSSRKFPCCRVLFEHCRISFGVLD